MRVKAGKCPPETRVWLDDVEQKGIALWADDVTGQMERLVLDADGKAQPDASGDQRLTEVVTGKVRIEVPEWFAKHLARQ